MTIKRILNKDFDGETGEIKFKFNNGNLEVKHYLTQKKEPDSYGIGISELVENSTAIVALTASAYFCTTPVAD